MTILQVVLCWMAITSVIAFFYFGWDKRRAEKGKSRVPERVLLAWSVVGGAPGGLLAMLAFRHKIRTKAFWVLEVAALGLWLWLIFLL